jgi:hypothetical protein
MTTEGPSISVVVIVYDMVAQAMNTLYSLSTAYQQDVVAGDYEVIVVENRSERVLDPEAVEALPGQFRYVIRDEPGKSPAAAINAGIALARGATIGLMIDGARMLTPGVLSHALMARRMTEGALVAVPGYQLGPVVHHMAHNRTPADDRALLDMIGWPAQGYRLFEVSSLSMANRMGFLRSFMECNCLFAPADVLRGIGGADERFDLPGGGALNLYIYHRLAHHPQTRLVVLPGEGSFHQIHGGVTTTTEGDYEARSAAFLAQLNALLGEPFKAPIVPTLYLGQLPQELLPFLQFSIERFKRSSAREAKVALAMKKVRPRDMTAMPMGGLAAPLSAPDREDGTGD